MSRRHLVRGEVRAIARGGDAVVETQSGVVLVPGPLPGERVELELTSSKRGAARGRLERVLEASPMRREPPCPVASRCGGCPLMSARPELQREVKLGFLAEACRGLPGADETDVEWIESPADLGYRRRARLAWHDEAMGYRTFHSKRVVDIDECLVLAEPLRAAWNEARACLASFLRGAGEIQLHLTGPNRAVVSLETQDEQPSGLYDACDSLSKRPPIAGVTLRTSGSGLPASWGDPHVVVETESGPVHGPAGSFFQANDRVNPHLVRAVVDLAEPDGLRVLELHSGVGNFTLELAARAGALVAVEQDPRAVEACRANLERRGLEGRVAVGDANRPPKGRFDVVVLDPPRQGARALFEDSSLLPGPKRVVYVSCDTATLSRDLRFATAKGYRIDRIIGFDMFPQTAHLESIVRLVRSR